MFSLLFIAAGAALGGVLYAAFYGVGLWAWSIGLAYIGYDMVLQAVLLVSAWRAIARPRPTPAQPEPALAVLIPGRNECAVLPATVAAIQPQLRPGDALLVIDDGSTDGTAEWCARAGVPVLRKPNSGKADSLNRAMQSVSQPVVITIDADTVLAPGALAAFRRAFTDPNLIAAGGVLVPVTRGTLLGRWFGWHQRAEYLRSFLWRAAWESWGTLLMVSGACAGYRRAEMLALGGLAVDSLVEDYEIIHRVQRAARERGLPWRIGMVPGAQATTDAPATLRLFLAQRLRWFAGFIHVQFTYRQLVGNVRYGALGVVMLPIKTLDLWLPLYGLLAWMVLAAFLGFGFSISPLIWQVLLGKLVYDLGIAIIAITVYRRWTGARVDWGSILSAVLTEIFVFQIVRHLGALLGWIAYLRRRTTWVPQR